MNPAYLEDASGFRGHADRVYVPQDEAEVHGDSARGFFDEDSRDQSQGAGTGITGGRVPFGGIVVSLEQFRKIEIQRRFGGSRGRSLACVNCRQPRRVRAVLCARSNGDFGFDRWHDRDECERVAQLSDMATRDGTCSALRVALMDGSVLEPASR